MADEEIPPSTLPVDLSVQLRGFADSQHANDLGRKIGEVLYVAGTTLNLERLDGVTVAHDYESALGELNRGYKSRNVLTRSADYGILGIAMTPSVIREGVLKAHIVLEATVTEPLLDDKHEFFRGALYTVMHEAGHVHDLAMRDQAFPGVLLRSMADYLSAVLFDIADHCWSEYAASRLSAYVWPENLVNYERTFGTQVSLASNHAREIMLTYGKTCDHTRALKEMVHHCSKLFNLAGYLFGHVAGLADLESATGTAAVLTVTLDEARPRRASFERLNDMFSSLWANYGHWQGTAVYEPLQELVLSFIHDSGLSITRTPGGPWVKPIHPPQVGF